MSDPVPHRITDRLFERIAADGRLAGYFAPRDLAVWRRHVEAVLISPDRLPIPGLADSIAGTGMAEADRQDLADLLFAVMSEEGCAPGEVARVGVGVDECV